MNREIAKHLLKIGAVFLRPDQPFTWASGIKSPIYCDNRLILTSPEARNVTENAIAEVIRARFPEADVLMGTATAGIAHAAIAAHILGMSMGYVRAGAKDHGRANQIEGKMEEGSKVVVVEDLISTAKSSLEVVDVLRGAGAEVLGMVSIFTYGMQKGRVAMASADVKAVSLCDLDTLLEVAVEGGYIKQSDCAKLIAFRDNPQDESWTNK
jgi:orotate phosphoribosyltransferase